MSKKFKTAFIIVLVVQLIIPFTSLLKYAETSVDKNKNVQTVKLIVNDVSFDYYMYVDSIFELNGEGNSMGVSFVCDAMDELYYEEGEYIIFQKKDDGFSTPAVVDEIGDNKCFLIKDNMYEVLKGCTFKCEAAEKYGEELDLTLYSSVSEDYNIRNGKVEGPKTRAYVELEVYNNQVEILNIYINDIPVDEYIEKVASGELDASRYDIFK